MRTRRSVENDFMNEKNENIKVGRYLITPITQALENGWYACSVSILSGAHLGIVPKVLALMKENGLGEVPVVVGGIIPDEDAAELKRQGVAEIFQPGTPLDNIVTVPTADVLRGDFSKMMSAACRTPAATLGAPFVDNKIDPALYHPLSRVLLAMMPVADPANDPNGCGRYIFLTPNDTKDQQPA